MPRGAAHRRVRNSISNEDRKRIIDLHESGGDIIRLADHLGINRDTVRSIVRVWMEEGRVEKLPQGGRRHVKVDDEMRNEMLRLAREKPFTTLVEIQDGLLRNFPEKHVHTSTIARHLRNNLISLKIAGKDADVPWKRNTPEAKESRFQHATWLSTLPVNHHVIYVDECGFNIYQRRTQGRAPIGQRVRREVGGERGRNVNVILAINDTHGLVAHSIEQKTLDHTRYQEFVDYLVGTLAQRFPPNEMVYIIHDGARPHLNTVIKPEYQMQFSIRTQPPYSPFLNPTEMAHSCFKADISRQLTEPTTQEELLDLANLRQQAGLTMAAWRGEILKRCARNALTQITQAKCANWFRHSLAFLPACLARQDING